MAIESLNYLDIPAEKRSITAAKAINRLYERLNETGVSQEQRQELLDQAKRIEKWLAGTLPVPPKGA
jgi:hypothetical protein